MKKFLGKLFTFALYAFVIGTIGKAGYDMFGNTDKLKREAELVDRYENFVPEEVSPYVENPDGAQYYYKSIGGEFYSGQWWEMDGIPVRATMSGDGFEEQDITEYFSYDEKMHTFIIKEELLCTLGNGYHHIKVYYDDETFEEYGFEVEDALVNNVPAQHAFHGDNRNNRVNNKLSDVQEISLYYSNIGDNRIVDVLICNGDSVQGVLDPENYIISDAGNKASLKKEYLETLEPNTKKQYGVRLADGTIISDSPDFWTMKDEWAGCVFEDVKDYSLSEGGDYTIKIKRNDADKIFSISIESMNWEEGIKYVEETDLDFGGSDYFVVGGNTLTIPEEVMKTLPVDKELKLLVSYSFDYSRRIYCGEEVAIKVVP